MDRSGCGRHGRGGRGRQSSGRGNGGRGVKQPKRKRQHNGQGRGGGGGQASRGGRAQAHVRKASDAVARAPAPEAALMADTADEPPTSTAIPGFYFDPNKKKCEACRPTLQPCITALY